MEQLFKERKGQENLIELSEHDNAEEGRVFKYPLLKVFYSKWSQYAVSVTGFSEEVFSRPPLEKKKHLIFILYMLA